MTEEELAAFEASADALWLTSDQRRVVRKLVKEYRKDPGAQWVNWDATSPYAYIGPHVPKGATLDILLVKGATILDAYHRIHYWALCGDDTITHYRLR